MHAEIDKLLGKGRINGDKANRLKALVTGSTSKESFADADFVLEAVFEEMKVKQQVFAEVEAVVSDTCILATNTSSLSVTEMASGLEHPERVVGFHFFNPVAILPLLEIARAEKTDDAAVATAFAVGKTLKKSCVLVKDAPGVRRQPACSPGSSARSPRPSTRARRSRSPTRRSSRSACRCRRSCCCSSSGPAVALHVAETMHEAFPDRFYVSDNLGQAGRGRQVRRLRLGGLNAQGRPRGARALRARRRSRRPRTRCGGARSTRSPRRST